jgi:predicted nucleic acid-binding protein
VDTLVDANVILDVVTEDSAGAKWSEDALLAAAAAGRLVINPIVYAEISVAYERIEDVEAALLDDVERHPLPWEAGFLAGKLFLRYRRAGGRRRSPLPDFYIGAHAATAGMTLLTRDAGRYRSYLPRLPIIAPA